MMPPVTDNAAITLPESARIGRWPLTMMWWASCSAIAYLFLGVQLATKFGTLNALLGMILAACVVGCMGAVLAAHALRAGASSSVLSQVMFGTRGGALPTLIVCVTLLYYAVFEGAVVATTAVKVWPSSSDGLVVLIVVLYSAPLSIGSVQNSLNKLNAILLPFYVLGLVTLAAFALRLPGAANAWLRLGPQPSLSLAGCWNCVVPYFGTLALAMITMDIARFGKRADEHYHTTFNFGIPFYLATYLPAGAVGIFIVAVAAAGQSSDAAVLDACLRLLGGVAGIIWVTVTQTRINSANFYVSTINLQAFLQEALHLRVSKVACAALVGVAAFLFMRSPDVLGSILTAANYLGILLIAWVGIAIAHVLGMRRCALPEEPCEFRWRGLIAWAVGVGAGVGVGMLGGAAASWAAPTTLVVSGLVYRGIQAPSVSALGEVKRASH